MAIHPILYLPDPRLRAVSKPVVHFDDKLQILIDDMFETMYDARGVGLAAPQIGISLRLSVIDIAGDKQNQLVIINPEIIASEGEKNLKKAVFLFPALTIRLFVQKKLQ